MSNVYEKLQKARIELQNTELKKSGHNKFAGYKYFELGDFLPTIQNIFDRHGLFGHISFNTELAVLNIRAVDKPEDSIQFLSPMSSAALKGCHDVQNLGAVQTYLRRYLWVNAMEICEHDALDSVTGESEVKKPIESKPVEVFTQEELTQERKLAEVIEGKEPKIYSRADLEKVGWVMKVTSFTDVTDESSKEIWLEGIKDNVYKCLAICDKEDEVMALFKKNKQLFDTIKALDATFFANMMNKFTEVKNNLKGK
jgi:hypothetical protein